ncbi:hypothetical protein EDC04DRAFT_657176 [Pisolithus marmoratus]|nr:hypothetical protein EDC04DRAFT_657176 [Pisolithus marmoratus]
MGGTTPIFQSRTSPLIPLRIRTLSNVPAHESPRPDMRTSTVARPPRLVTHGTNGIIPIRPLTLLVFALLLSTLFTIAISFSFLGHDADEPYFKQMLNDVAEANPGIVLLGENVDVDVDEPSIGIRWSILGCGNGYVLEGSAGVHGSDLCGLPSFYLEIYVDRYVGVRLLSCCVECEFMAGWRYSSVGPTAIYDPSHLPFVSQTGRRRDIQNLVQFDSDHTLDVHLDRLYPFDNYILTSTLRAVSASNATIPIQKLATIDEVSGFVIESVDMETYEVVSSPTSGTTDGVQTSQIPTRDIDLYVSRPVQARAFTLLLFALSWSLAHATLMCVYLARKCSSTHVSRSAKPILKHLGGSLMVLLVIPQLRNAMPDAPGYDGVLIDCIGFFPQMILSSLSVFALLLLMILRELEGIQGEDKSSVGVSEQPTPHHSRTTQPMKPASPPSPAAFSTDPEPTSKAMDEDRVGAETYRLASEASYLSNEEEKPDKDTVRQSRNVVIFSMTRVIQRKVISIRLRRRPSHRRLHRSPPLSHQHLRCFTLPLRFPRLSLHRGPRRHLTLKNPRIRCSIIHSLGRNRDPRALATAHSQLLEDHLVASTDMSWGDRVATDR